MHTPLRLQLTDISRAPQCTTLLSSEVRWPYLIQPKRPRMLALRKIVEEAGPEQMLGWVKPRDEDYALFGEIIHVYSSFDFILRYMAETMDKQGMFKEPWAGKTQKLTMAQVAEAIQSSPIWTGSNKLAR